MAKMEDSIEHMATDLMHHQQDLIKLQNANPMGQNSRPHQEAIKISTRPAFKAQHRLKGSKTKFHQS